MGNFPIIVLVCVDIISEDLFNVQNIITIKLNYIRNRIL